MAACNSPDHFSERRVIVVLPPVKKSASARITPVPTAAPTPAGTQAPVVVPIEKTHVEEHEAPASEGETKIPWEEPTAEPATPVPTQAPAVPTPVATP
jgi:hypothetical protein